MYKELWENYGFISVWKLSFLGSGFLLFIMDNDSALLPYLQFTVVGFAAFLDRFYIHMKKYATPIDLNI